MCVVKHKEPREHALERFFEIFIVSFPYRMNEWQQQDDEFK